MATLQEAIDAVQAAVGALSGIRAAPDEPTDGAPAFPFVVAYALEGVWTNDTPQTKRGVHDIAVELHVDRSDLARDIATAMGYSESIPNAIFDIATDTGGAFYAAVDSGPSAIEYTFGPLGWAGVESVGFRFILRGVKQRSTIT